MSEFDGQILAWNNRKRLKAGYQVLFITKRGYYTPGETVLTEHDDKRSQYVVKDTITGTLHLIVITRTSPSTLVQFKVD